MKKGSILLVSMLLAIIMGILCGNGFAQSLSGDSPFRSSQTTGSKPATLSGAKAMSAAGAQPGISAGLEDEEAKLEKPGKKPSTLSGAKAMSAAGDQPGTPAGPEEAEEGKREKPEKTRPAEQTGAVREELSQLEMMVSLDEKAAQKSLSQPYQTRELLQFGYNYFKPATEFAALTDIPVGNDYIIGPGDKFTLNLWGSVEGTYELEVNRSGEVFIPTVGNVRVWGVSFGRMQEILRARISTMYKDFGFNVTMGKLRLMKVFVVGEVKAPGDYNLSSLSTLINALSAAGGPLKTGSLRNIQIRRGGAVVDQVDLYDFFLKGDKSRDIRLQSGDTIFVPVIGKVAGIAGNVKRPAIYELKDEKKLQDLFNLAAGMQATGYLQRIQISRIDAHDKKIVTDFNIDPKFGDKSVATVMDQVRIQDLDIVRVFSIDMTLRDHVRIEGHVLRPGDYSLKPGMQLSSLLKKEELLPEYYENSAQVIRLYPPNKRPGTFFIDLNKALSGDPEHDLVLNEFDTIRIFSMWEMEEMPKVTINGEVQKPGEFRLFKDMTVKDLVMVAGNLKNSAYTQNAEISRIKRTGETVTSYPIIINLEEALKGNSAHNVPLMPLDQLTVRRIPNWTEETERFVTLKGEFVFPGTYPIYKGERLSTLIERAGGFSGHAYLKGARFFRESLRQTQQKRMDEEIARAEQEILKKQAELASNATSKEEVEGTQVALNGLKQQLGALKIKRAEGRMIIQLASLKQLKGSRYDVELAGGDVLEVVRNPEAVNIVGQVYNPSSVVHAKGEDVEYYLDQVGGPTQDANERGMYLVRADGTVVSKKQSGFIFGGFMSRGVDSGDTIVVPTEYDKTPWMRNVKDIAVILGQIALTAGVIVAAGL